MAALPSKQRGLDFLYQAAVRAGERDLVDVAQGYPLKRAARMRNGGFDLSREVSREHEGVDVFRDAVARDAAILCCDERGGSQGEVAWV